MMRIREKQGRGEREELLTRVKRGRVERSADAFARRSFLLSLFAVLLIATLSFTACSRNPLDRRSVAPRSLRDVPAQKLAYNFQADVAAPPDVSDSQNKMTRLEAVQKDFDERRKDDALVRTVTSPDGQRVLALYETGDNEKNTFRIDMYGIGGAFLRNVTPPELACVFPATVAWSPDGNYIAFTARRSAIPQPTPDADAIAPAVPSATVAPIFVPVQTFSTEQIYVCNRDGFDLKPITTRDGLIYFYLAWSPDASALVALACTEKEWDARPVELLPAGRPRIVGLNGQERLLDDGLTDVLPVWSPDSSKVATAFETDVAIYDAVTQTPTSARIPLRDPLLASSVEYDEKNLKKKPSNKQPDASSKPQSGAPPVSFNPVVRLQWSQPETLYLETGFLRLYANEPVSRDLRWHKLALSVQATQLSQLTVPSVRLGSLNWDLSLMGATDDL